MTTGNARDWARYYRHTSERPPRETLLEALDRFDAEPAATRSPRLAVDLGCGGGRDIVAMLDRGFRVLAIDAQPDAIAQLRERFADVPAARLETRIGRFDEVTWPRCDLVNSSFALPLQPRHEFERTWTRIRESLVPGGRFSGQLFGPRDEWAGDPTLTHLTANEVDTLLADLEVERREEEETESVTPRGRSKHWHLYHLVVRKPG